VFANEAELHMLYQTSDFDTALKRLRADTKLGVVTRSERLRGRIRERRRRGVVVPIEKLVDTTGAGDLFAAGSVRPGAQRRSCQRRPPRHSPPPK
jgi:adenosine kinase